MIKNVYWFSCKVPVLLSDFNESLIFSTDLGKKFSNMKFVKNRPVGAELFRADGRTDV